ncbi:hypothetical protein [Butyrivibrio sp. INlla16]|uniref:hypothetical protein n=1 Tax=Butyrivibrio sp. INlla16 TaxID=1520807 RepID=UPI00088341A5|nr:hypothetical protein [Butyrivibrio sp. INlla16]SDB55797.1 hypothetical protein SAMN02910263_02849 [Butyrivibrio sp. INlla16]
MGIKCRNDYLTWDAREIIENKIGYRDDTLFPANGTLSTNKRNPMDVAITEILSCGKYEICDFIIIHYADMLSRRDYRFLLLLIDEIKYSGYPILDSQMHVQLRRIIEKLIQGFDYCIWLCAEPDIIYDYYLKDYIPKAEKSDPGFMDSCPEYSIKAELSKREYIERYVTSYNIPKDYLILCDLGKEGILICWKEASAEE